MPSQTRTKITDVTQNKMFQEINPGTFCICWIILVDQARENWNCMLEDLIILSDHLDELDIKGVIQNSIE